MADVASGENPLSCGAHLHSPTLCVVMPTYNRPAQAAAAAHALAAQDLSGWESMTLVVVDDSSTPDSFARLQEALRHLPRSRLLRRARNGGPAAARNDGWRASGESVIAFTDDDCMVQPGWAMALLREFQRPAVDMVQGRTLPASDSPMGRGPFTHSVTVSGSTPWFESCNLAVRRHVLEHLGGFDERFAQAYGEDTDFGWRALESGFLRTYSADALVRHDVIGRRFLADLRVRSRNTAVVDVVKRHPQLRRHLSCGVFYDQTHPLALIASAGIIAGLVTRRSGLRGVAPLLALPYLRYRFRRSIKSGPRVAWPMWLAQHLILDMVDVARFAKRSLGARELVL